MRSKLAVADKERTPPQIAGHWNSVRPAECVAFLFCFFLLSFFFWSTVSTRLEGPFFFKKEFFQPGFRFHSRFTEFLPSFFFQMEMVFTVPFRV